MMKLDTPAIVRKWCEKNPPKPLASSSAWLVSRADIDATVKILREFGWVCERPTYLGKPRGVIITFDFSPNASQG